MEIGRWQVEIYSLATCHIAFVRGVLNRRWVGYSKRVCLNKGQGQMPYYDISGRLELQTSASAPVLRERLIAALSSLQVEAHANGSTVEFQAPFIKTVTRGFKLQGASFGQIELEVLNNRCAVNYRIATMPMRLFCVALGLIGLVYPSATYIAGLPWSPSSLLFSTFGTLLLSGLAYMAGRAVVSWKFGAFMRVVASGSRS
jgi:hypothetical protein